MTYWVLVDGEKVGEIITKEPLNQIAKTKALAVFAEGRSMSLRGYSIKEVGR